MTQERDDAARRPATGLFSAMARRWPGFAMSANGPWGGKPGGDQDASPDHAPQASESDPPKKPDNPWKMPPGGPERRRGPSALDQILGAGRARMGGGGGPGGFPTLPNGKPIWPYLGLGLLAIWLLWTSVWRIDAGEAGVVTTFGKYSRTLGPGLNLTLPAPLEDVDKVKTTAIRKLQIGSTAPDQQNLVLTRDENLIDLAYTVRWNIRNAARFRFQVAFENDDPDSLIREVAETAMRATIATLTLDEATGLRRSDISQQVQQRMQAILNSYRSGIQIQGIDLRQTDPPSAVAEAFKEVTSAQQRAEANLNRAQTYAAQVVEQAKGEAQRFDKVYEEYRLAPEVTKRRMYYDTMEKVLGRLDKTIIEANGVTPYLPLSELRRRAVEPAAEPGATVVAPARNDRTDNQKANSRP